MLCPLVTLLLQKEYWRLVEEKECHVAVHCGRVDTKTHELEICEFVVRLIMMTVNVEVN